jgi:hypothetical protein
VYDVTSSHLSMRKHACHDMCRSSWYSHLLHFMLADQEHNDRNNIVELLNHTNNISAVLLPLALQPFMEFGYLRQVIPCFSIHC